MRIPAPPKKRQAAAAVSVRSDSRGSSLSAACAAVQRGLSQPPWGVPGARAACSRRVCRNCCLVLPQQALPVCNRSCPIGRPRSMRRNSPCRRGPLGAICWQRWRRLLLWCSGQSASCGPRTGQGGWGDLSRGTNSCCWCTPEAPAHCSAALTPCICLHSSRQQSQEQHASLELRGAHRCDWKLVWMVH